MDGAMKNALKNALKRAGAHRYTLLRQPRDPNGQPEGEWAQAGALYGCAYRSRQTQRLSIDIPGIVATPDQQARLLCLVCAGEAPEEGDMIVHGDSGTDQTGPRIVAARSTQGYLWELTLDGEIA